MADYIDKTGIVFRVLTATSPVTWNNISFWGKASDVEFNDQLTAEYKLGAINGITSEPNSTLDNLCASAKLVNYVTGEHAEIELKSLAWSSGTTRINNINYHSIEVDVEKILLAHPIIYLAINDIPTDAVREFWAGLEMVADVSNNKLNFYIETVPSFDVTVGVKGVIPQSSI